MFEISVEDTFAAGHSLRNYRGKCEKVHGHNYKVQVTVGGAELDSAGGNLTPGLGWVAITEPSCGVDCRS